MENLFLVKLEIFILLLSFWYIIYFLWNKLYIYLYDIKKIIKPENNKKLHKIKKINIESKENNYKKQWKNNCNLSEKQKEQLSKIIKRVKNNTSKWYSDLARNLIVEWLAIDKYNKDLNIELAKIYEKEKKYKNAEYIYNEIIENIKNATSVIKKLWFVLAKQKKYKKSIKAYERVYKRDKTDIEVIDMLADLNYKVEDYNISLKYVILSLKDTPRNVSKLMLAWNSYEMMKDYENALIYYNKILEVQPYNTDIQEKIEILKNN